MIGLDRSSLLQRQKELQKTYNKEEYLASKFLVFTLTQTNSMTMSNLLKKGLRLYDFQDPFQL